MTIEIDESMTLIFTNKQKDRYYFHGSLESSDVAPGPIRISGINLEECEDKFFLFWIADTFSPPMYIVNASSFEQAYEQFVDWQVDQLKIDDADLPKNGEQLYKEHFDKFEVKSLWEDEAENIKRLWNQKAEESEGWQNMNFSSYGVPVDTEAIGGEEVDLLLTLNDASDRNLWNLAGVFLGRVVRFENKYDPELKFITAMSKCCSNNIEKAKEAFNRALSIWLFKF